jgi:hypothetical protein
MVNHVFDSQRTGNGRKRGQDGKVALFRIADLG